MEESRGALWRRWDALAGGAVAADAERAVAGSARAAGEARGRRRLCGGQALPCCVMADELRRERVACGRISPALPGKACLRELAACPFWGIDGSGLNPAKD